MDVPTAVLPRASIRATSGLDGIAAARGDETYQASAPCWQVVILWLILVGPFVAIAGVVVLATRAGIGPTWLDAGLFFAFYAVSGHGVTVGFHRYLTHRAFTAMRTLRVALAISGSLSVEGSVISWVAAHRRHHARSDQVGDPHSPWRFGTTPGALVKGMWWAQLGWLFSDEHTREERFAPDLLADRDIARVNALFPLWVFLSLTAPAALGGLITMSWTGALTAFLWAGVVRMFVLHHVTWSVNSVCHVVGSRPFRSRDKSTNCWPLAIASMGESWHNSHHADPTSARHGVDRWQVDSSAVLIRQFERLGWATNVHWPVAERMNRRRR